MDVSIVIVNYKTKGLLKYCLKGIERAAPSLSFEVIVVDNSRDGSAEMIKECFRNVRCIESSRNLGFAAGNNLGIVKASGKYILILNPDIVVLPRAIDEMHSFLERHPEVGILGPQLINPDKSIQYSCARFPTHWIPAFRRTPLGKLPGAQEAIRHYLMMDFDHQETRAVDWLLGACLMVRRSAFDQVGLLDERFFLYFEDVDWCRRFWEAGFQVVYYPKAKMVHYHQRLSAEDSGLQSLFSSPTRIHILSGIKYFLKYLGKENPQLK